MNEKTLEYKGGKLSKIVIESLRPFIDKIKRTGVKKSIENLIPGINADEFVLKKIKHQLCKRRGIQLSGGLGRVDVQYRYDGIQIEFFGILRFFVKRITITDEQIIKSFDSIINQIEKKYILDDSYIINKTDTIICSLSDTQIYKPKTSEEKTLYDLAMLILLNYYKSSDDIPKWIEPALRNIAKGEFIEKWIDILVEYISEVIAQVSEEIFFDFKVTFDSVVVRSILNKKTNRGQLSHLLGMFDINIKEIIYNFAKDYVSPSFIRGASEILCEIAGNFLGNCFKSFPKNLKWFKENIPEEPYNITVTLGENAQSDRNFRWFTSCSINDCVLEYSYDEDFSNVHSVIPVCKKKPKTWPLLNLGLVSSYEIIYLNEYSVSLKNLREGNIYYRILYSGDKKSSVYKIKIKNPSKEFKFMILTDSQGMVKTDYEVFSNMLENAVKREKNTDFMIHLGDFVDDGNNEEYWKWVLKSRAWKENAAVVLSGNHEARINAKADKAGVDGSVCGHFNLCNLPFQDTKFGAYYSFVYGDATFIILNTNTGIEGELDKKQYKWALSVAKNAKTKWKILCAHKSPYSNGPHHKDYDVKKIGRQINDLAYYGEIDVVFGGHDHVYVRTPFLIEGTPEKRDSISKKLKDINENKFINPKGTVFVVPSTSGVKNYGGGIVPDFPICKSLNVANPVYSTVKINDEGFFFSSYEFNIKDSGFKEIDSFSIFKDSKFENQADGKTVSSYIDSIPDIPGIDNDKIINKIKSMYEKLEYSEKLKVKNYDKFLNAVRKNESYKNIQKMDIRVVRSRHEFMSALKEPTVGTIITNCSEIRFENHFSLNGKVIIDRDICITGEAKLSHVTFVLKQGVFCVLSGNVCVDNTRKPFSLYPARNIFEMNHNCVLAIEKNAAINGGYGLGFKGYGINMTGENTSVYLNSSGHNFVSRGVVNAPERTSMVSIGSGKYLSSGGCYTFTVNGLLKVSGGFIRSIKGCEKSKILINSGIIGENNKLQYPVPIETYGKIEVSGGMIKNRNGISVYVHGKNNMESSYFGNSVDITGKILYN